MGDFALEAEVCGQTSLKEGSLVRKPSSLDHIKCTPDSKSLIKQAGGRHRRDALKTELTSCTLIKQQRGSVLQCVGGLSSQPQVRAAESLISYN